MLHWQRPPDQRSCIARSARPRGRQRDVGVRLESLLHGGCSWGSKERVGIAAVHCGHAAVAFALQHSRPHLCPTSRSRGAHTNRPSPAGRSPRARAAASPARQALGRPRGSCRGERERTRSRFEGLHVAGTRGGTGFILHPCKAHRWSRNERSAALVSWEETSRPKQAHTSAATSFTERSRPGPMV